METCDSSEVGTFGVIVEGLVKGSVEWTAGLVSTVKPRRPGRSRWRDERRGGGGCAVLLGATLALGSTAMAGCQSEARFDPKLPMVDGRSESRRGLEDEPEDAAPPTEIALDAEEGRGGRLEVAPGFTPDPLSQEGATLAGPIDAQDLDERCQGWVSSEPDYVLSAERPFAELAVTVASSEPLTLMIVGPGGETRCASMDGPQVALRGHVEQGSHRIWVGTQAPGVRAPYVLGLSELEE